MSTIDLDKKAEAALLLACGTSTEKTGEAVGVSGRTVRRWLDDTTFRADVDAHRREIIADAVRGLTGASRDAITVLRAALADESVNVRLRAATVLLGALPTLTQHFDLEGRIAALEIAADGQVAA